MAKELEKTHSSIRRQVKYVCAPTASGKTTSILPAFLASTKFSHYLYLAFVNNNKRNFRLSSLSPHVGVARKQGAAFALKCVATLLNNDDNTHIEICEADLPTEDASKRQLKELLDSHFEEVDQHNTHVPMCPPPDAHPHTYPGHEYPVPRRRAQENVPSRWHVCQVRR